MIRPSHLGIALLLAAAPLLLPSELPAQPLPTATAINPAFQPTAVERQAAISLAERALTQRGLRTSGPLYLISVELLNGKDDEGTQDRKAIVTHYRYDGDLTILTFVNLARGQVSRVDSVAHLPTQLSLEEFTTARNLGLADARVRTALGPYLSSATVEAMNIRATQTQDPIFGHRVVRLLFRVGQDYLIEPYVNVDLTSAKVVVREAPTGEQAHKHSHGSK